MASPFSIFRKNQRVWMAGLVFVAVLSFVVLPSIDNFQSAGRNLEGRQTLVSWKGTRLTAEQLQRQTAVQAQTYAIFSRLATEVVAAGGTPRVPGYAPGPQGSIGLQPPSGRAGLVELKTLAEAARENGVVVSDGTIDLFIRNFTDGKISPKKYEEIVQEVAGKQLTRFDIYNYLRDEISKQLLVQMGLSGFTSSSQPLIAPSKNWLNFQKLQQRAKVEIYPVFVDQFVEKVTAKPSDSELKALYEKGKDLYSIPSQPDPGFRYRYKADFEYLFADFNALIKEEQEKITPEQLLAEYEKRVAAGSYKVPMAEFKPTETEPAADAKPKDAPAEKAADAPKTNEADASAKPPESKPADAKTMELPADKALDDLIGNSQKPTMPAAESTTPAPTTPAPTTPAPTTPAPTTPAPTTPAPTTPAPTTPAPTTPAPTTPAPATPAPATPAPATPAPATPAPATPAPTTPAPTTPAPATPAPATPAPATTPTPTTTPAPATDTPNGASGKSSQVIQRSAIRLVAFQDEAAKPVAEAAVEKTAEKAVEKVVEKATEKVVEPTSAVDPAKPADAKPMADVAPAKEAAPAATTTAPETSSVTPVVPTETKPADPAAAAASTPATAAEKPMRVQTLEEVREALLREMALPGARARAQEMVDKVSIKMSDYGAKKDFFENQDKRSNAIPKPEPLDLKALATETGMTFSRTGMIDNLSVSSLPIAQSYLQLSNPGARSNPFASFPEYALMEPRGENGLRLYQVQMAQSLSSETSGTYVFWKVAEEASRVPTFEESREELTTFWKQSRAQELAQKAAEEMTSKLNSITDASVNPWTQVLESHLQPLVMSPSPFTWLLPMMTGAEGAQLSTVEGIDLPGQAFMEKVFSAPVGKSVVTFDAPKKKCFVVRVIERLPTDDDLRIQFERSPLNRGVSSLANQQSMNMVRGWFASLLETMGLETRQLEELE